jgi:hypothetical protein|tara:strand:+ start:526 stop:1131 length:606 start_codon:yes stop_codon:yes gene_type:complete
MSIMVMISIVMIGCTNQPPPIPTLMPTPMVIVDERLIVMDALIRFNNTNNTFIKFLSVNGDIYQLEGESTYHVSYIASKQIMLALEVYANAIRNWTIPDTEYHDRLIEIKEAELYRIEHFSELTELMLMVLPTEDDDAIQAVRDQFLGWRDDIRNMKPMNLQNDIIKELNISPDDINFLYIVPDKPLPTLPPQFNEGDNRS